MFFTYRPEKLEKKAIINDCKQSNCVCVSENMRFLLIRIGVPGAALRESPLPGGPQGAEPPGSSRIFQQNKGIQDGRQEW